MFTKLIGAATLFAAGSLMAGGSTALGASPVQSFNADTVLAGTGGCGSQDPKDEAKAPAKAKDGKAKDGSCGKGSCAART